MEYNLDYLDVKYALIKAFMFSAREELLDVSYTRKDQSILIQVVLLKDKPLIEEVRKKVKKNLSEFQITFTEIYISKDQFNENRGEWLPKYYHWFEYVLFSKTEVL